MIAPLGPSTLEACVDYLESKSTTLWGDWDLTKPERLAEAAAWLADQVQEVNRRIGLALVQPRPIGTASAIPYNDLRRNLPA